MHLQTKNVEKIGSKIKFIREPVTHHTIILFLVCTVLIGFSLYWNISNLHEDKSKKSLAEAKSNWNKDQAFRGWATKHGGLYVKPDSRTQPNPYLAHIPDRDIVTTDGVELTLLNPAFMMRQMIGEYEEDYGVKGSITGRIVLNPINVPDEWELKALDKFDSGFTEFYEEALINGEPFLRYMRPMYMKDGCVKCHGHLGFKVGDLRGGVSVSIPLNPYVDSLNSTSKSIVITHLIIISLVYMLISIYGWTSRKRELERLGFDEERKQQQKNLEERVINRTEELNLKQQEAMESTKRLEQIMSTAADGIISVNKKGIIESFNRAAENMFGYKANDVIGKNIKFLVPEPDKSNHDEYIKKYIETGKSKIIGKGREVEAQKKDGSYIPVSVAVSDMISGDKRAFTAIIRDITYRKEYEKALIFAKNEAEKANQIKTDFLSSMSHDLRTPLNAIIGFAQLLEFNPDEVLTKTQNECVEQILGGGKHLLNIINDILDLAKIDAGKAEIVIENIDLKLVIDECLVLVAPLIKERDIQLSDNYKARANKVIEADNTRIKQVLLNIISNAIKYNKKSGRITIDYHQTEDNMIRISVEDTGLGISESRQAEIFKPFTRVSNQSLDIEGTGIGLTVSHKLIELMGGSIGFESEYGKGSKFWIDVPLVVTAESNKDVDIGEDTDISQLISNRAATILYVEDNRANLRLMQMLISNFENLQLISAINAEVGIELAKEKQPDIILLDINLPGMSGFEALKVLKASTETDHIPVIAISAAAAQDDIDRGIAAGFRSYLTKPIVIEEVLSNIESILSE